MKINVKEIITKYFGQIMNTKTLIIIFIIGIGLMMLPSGKTETPKEKSEPQDTYKVQIEADLESIITKIKGAGRVDVMVTLSDGGDTVYAADERVESGENTKTNEKSYVFAQGSGNAEEPLIVRKTQPEISGVLICAQGAGDPQVKSDIISAASALLGIKSHRIEVLERG